MCHGAVVAGGQDRRGAPLPAFLREAAAARAAAKGVAVVMDRCPAIEWSRQGLPDHVSGT